MGVGPFVGLDEVRIVTAAVCLQLKAQDRIRRALVDTVIGTELNWLHARRPTEDSNEGFGRKQCEQGGADRHGRFGQPVKKRSRPLF